MPRKPSTPTNHTLDGEAADLVWGARAIGDAIGRKRSQVYYLVETGALRGVVKKLSGKTMVASRKRLEAFLAGE